MTHMADDRGRDCTDQQEIADIFADFYEKLYASQVNQQSQHERCGGSEIPQFTCQELEVSIRELKNGKARDGAGVFAELIKNGGPMLVDVLVILYNQVIAVDAVPPSSWKASIVSVLHKSGERSKAENYRPITIIPLLYKPFARLLYARLHPLLDLEQSMDQAGFRPRFSTLHHLSALIFILEKAY